MIIEKYLIRILPLFLVVTIHLFASYLDTLEGCTVFSKLRASCDVYGYDFQWFSDLAFMNLLFGWFVALGSILAVGNQLGRDLPQPWGKGNAKNS